jgi:hypothetical protein
MFSNWTVMSCNRGIHCFSIATKPFNRLVYISRHGFYWLSNGYNTDHRPLFHFYSRQMKGAIVLFNPTRHRIYNHNSANFESFLRLNARRRLRTLQLVESVRSSDSPTLSTMKGHSGSQSTSSSSSNGMPKIIWILQVVYCLEFDILGNLAV